MKKQNILGVQFHGISGISSLLRGLDLPLITKVHGLWDAKKSIIRHILLNEARINPNFNFKGKFGKCLIHLDAKTINRICFKLSPHLIATSQSVKLDLHSYYGISQNRITTVNNGVNHDLFSPKSPSEKLKRDLNLDSAVIMFNGDFSSIKGFFYLPYILKRVSRKAQVCLLIVGGYGSSRFIAMRRAFSKFGLDSKVKFVGYVPYHRLSQFYSLADVFICPSLYEGFGNAPLEAMACGKPIVSFKTSGLNDFIDDTVGYAVEYEKIEAFSDKVLTLLSDESLRSQKGKKAYERSLSFSWEVTARKTIRTLEGCKA